jgi:hypothetical protein
MKKIQFILMLIFTLSNNIMAQNNVMFHYTYGSKLSLPMQSIDSVRFNSSANTISKRVFLRNGDILNFKMSNIDSITYYLPDTLLLAKVIANTITDINSFSVSSSGTVISDGGTTLIQRGFCWSLSPNPTLIDNFSSDGNGIGAYNSSIYPLSASTKYYIRPYAINATGVSYGNQLVFNTASQSLNGNAPTITTATLQYNDSLSAICGGTISADGGLAITSRGVCWSINATPTINNNRTINGTGGGSFVSNIKNLIPNALYYIRAYATNAAGTAYGITYSFNTKDFSVLHIDSVFNIKAKSANVEATIISDGGAIITSRGFCWSRNSQPTIADKKVSSPSGGIGKFTLQISSLFPDTINYVRAYSINSIGISYSKEFAIKTKNGIADLFLDSVFNIIAQSAIASAKIINDGGADITVRGFCWDTTSLPTISQNVINSGNNIGQYIQQLDNLPTNKLIYVRAFASNSVRITYSNEIIFRTKTGIPDVVIDSVHSITYLSSKATGRVINDNGSAVLSSGFCWSLNPNPTLNNSYTTNSLTSGVFLGDIEGLLILDTIYYIRAYSISQIDTAYSSQISFRTKNPCMNGICIGDSTQGGILAYLLRPGDPGFDANVPHGIISAPFDQSTTCLWSNAPGICNNLVLNGFSDWYLPNKDELKTLYILYINGLLTFSTSNYWSSTNAGGVMAYYFNFPNNTVATYFKNSAYHVRAIRLF